MRLHRELAIIAASITLFVGAHFICAEVDALSVQKDVVPTIEVQVSEDIPKENEPVVSVEEPEMSPEESILLEDERIEAALIQQGYYRTDIPLTYLEQDFLHTSCEEFGVPYELAVAVVWRETNFRNIVGDDGASVGYMQVQERWHRERMERLGVTDLTDPYSNFRVGCSYLGELLEKYGDTHKALMAYNMGPTSAAKLWRQGITTSKYSRAVIEYMEEVVCSGNQ